MYECFSMGFRGQPSKPVACPEAADRLASQCASAKALRAVIAEFYSVKGLGFRALSSTRFRA